MYADTFDLKLLLFQVLQSEAFVAALQQCDQEQPLGRPFVSQAAAILADITSHPEALSGQAAADVLDIVQCLTRVDAVYETVGDHSGSNILQAVRQVAAALSLPYMREPAARLRDLATRVLELIPALARAVSRSLAPGPDMAILADGECSVISDVPMCQVLLSSANVAILTQHASLPTCINIVKQSAITPRLVPSVALDCLMCLKAFLILLRPVCVSYAILVCRPS